MHRVLDSPTMTAPATGAAASFFTVAAVTAAIFLFRGFVPILSPGVLYVFAVLPVAVEWGLAFSPPGYEGLARTPRGVLHGRTAVGAP